jgi:hypothetical protein
MYRLSSNKVSKIMFLKYNLKWYVQLSHYISHITGYIYYDNSYTEQYSCCYCECLAWNTIRNQDTLHLAPQPINQPTVLCMEPCLGLWPDYDTQQTFASFLHFVKCNSKQREVNNACQWMTQITTRRRVTLCYWLWMSCALCYHPSLAQTTDYTTWIFIL